MTEVGRRFLDHHVTFHPVDGSFMGRRECDALLPRADRMAADDEARAIAALQAGAADAPEATLAERLDKRGVLAELTLAAATLAERPRFANPAWYSGEASFAILGLLLPQSAPLNVGAVTQRLAALPDFLSDATARLAQAGASACRLGRACASRSVGDGTVTQHGSVTRSGCQRCMAGTGAACGAGARRVRQISGWACGS